MGYITKNIMLALMLSIGYSNIIPDKDLAFDHAHELNNNKTVLRKSIPQTKGVDKQNLSAPYAQIVWVATCSLLLLIVYKVNKGAGRVNNLDPMLEHNRQITTDTQYQTSSYAVRAVETQAPVAMTARDIKWLEKLDELIKNELSNTLLKPIDLAEHMGVCERQLQRKLKELKGTSPAKYLKQKRLKMGYEYLQSGDFQTVAEVAYKVGYHSPNNFSRAFKVYFGMKPNDLLNTMIMV